jgi:hypothetical protein
MRGEIVDSVVLRDATMSELGTIQRSGRGYAWECSGWHDDDASECTAHGVEPDVAEAFCDIEEHCTRMAAMTGST